MMQNKFVFDPYPLAVTMQRLAENLKARRLEKKLSTMPAISALSVAKENGRWHLLTI